MTSSLQLHARATLNLSSALVPVLLLVLSVDSCKIILFLLFILFLIMFFGSNMSTVNIEYVGWILILVDIAYLNTSRDTIHAIQIFGRVIRTFMFCRHEVMFLLSRKHFTNYSGPKLSVANRTFDTTMTPSAVCLAFGLSLTSGSHTSLADATPMVLILILIFLAMLYTMKCLDRDLIYPVENMLSLLAESSNETLDDINKLGNGKASAKSPLSFHGDVVQYAVSGLAHALTRTLCNDADEHNLTLVTSTTNEKNNEKQKNNNTSITENNNGDGNKKQPRPSHFSIQQGSHDLTVEKVDSFDDTVDPLFWTPVSTLGNPFLDLYEAGQIREEEERKKAQTMTAESMHGVWDWDVLRLVRRHDCLDLVYRILEVDGLISHFNLEPDKLINLLNKVGERYLSNYFHNVWHGADVCYMTWRIIHEAKCEHWFKEIETLAAYISAFSHDVGHPGLTNPFLVKTHADIALLHNDQSPLENMHAAILSAFIRDTGVFEVLTEADRNLARVTMIKTILGTDTIHHNAQICDLHIFYETRGCLSPAHGGVDPASLDGSPFDVEQRNFLLEVIVHVADINNPAKDWEGCKAWGYLLMDEFFSQGEKEHELGFNVLPLFDKKVASVPLIEMNFGEFFYLPLLKIMIQIFPSLEPMGRNLTGNISNWAQLRITELLNQHRSEMLRVGLPEDAPLSKNLQAEIEMLEKRGTDAYDKLTEAMSSLISYAKRNDS